MEKFVFALHIAPATRDGAHVNFDAVILLVISVCSLVTQNQATTNFLTNVFKSCAPSPLKNVVSFPCLRNSHFWRNCMLFFYPSIGVRCSVLLAKANKMGLIGEKS